MKTTGTTTTRPRLRPPPRTATKAVPTDSSPHLTARKYVPSTSLLTPPYPFLIVHLSHPLSLFTLPSSLSLCLPFFLPSPSSLFATPSPSLSAYHSLPFPFYLPLCPPSLPAHYSLPSPFLLTTPFPLPSCSPLPPPSLPAHPSLPPPLMFTIPSSVFAHHSLPLSFNLECSRLNLSNYIQSIHFSFCVPPVLNVISNCDKQVIYLYVLTMVW